MMAISRGTRVVSPSPPGRIPEGDGADASAISARRRSGAMVARSTLVSSTEDVNLAAVCAFWRGEFGLVDELLAEADRCASVGPVTEAESRDVMLRDALAGVVASLRGEAELADECFERALVPKGDHALDVAQATVLAMRAGFAGRTTPDQTIADARRAREIADRIGAPQLAALATLGEGWALAQSGRLGEAALALASAQDRLDDVLECSVAGLRRAEVLMRLGDRLEARHLVDACREVFDERGARYWLTRAALLTGTIDRDRGGRWLRLARGTAGTDEAYARLFRPEGELRIEPARVAGVQRDGDPVRFLTRHAEATVRLLAAAGDLGVSVEVLASTFWPGADHMRVAARTRTMLWQARNSLGPDAWRIQRDRNTIRLDNGGLVIIGTTTAEAVGAEFRTAS